MSIKLSYEIFNTVVVYTLTALITLGINVVFILRARRSELLKAFINVQMMVVIWLLSKVLKKVSNSDEMVWLWVAVQYIAITTFGTIFLEFSFLYKTGRRMRLWLRRLLYGISFFNYAVLFTNQFHHLFFKSITVESNTYGPWFFVHTVFTYILIVAAYYFLIRALLNKDYDVPVLHAYLFNIGLIIPIATNVLFLFNIIPISFDITPVMFNLTILIFGYSAYRYRFLDIKKVTRSMVLENIHEGIVIVDDNMRIIQANNLIKSTIHQKEEVTDNLVIKEFVNKIRYSIEEYEEIEKMIENCFINKEEKMVTQFRMRQYDDEKSYILKMERLKDHTGVATGYVFRIIDVTKHRELIERLQESNEALVSVNQQLSENISVTKQLAVAKERSRVSKEVHDILGHSVTIVISLLQLSKVTIMKDKELAGEKVVQSMEIIRSGLKELKRSMRERSEDMMDTRHLIEELRKLINDYKKSGVEVDFYYKEVDRTISPDTFDTVYRICQEGMTNALRHGKAKNMTIGLRFIDDSIDLYIVDDGLGCDLINKGNGLSGMENRVTEQGGYFSCGSPDGEGFNIHATLPLDKA